MAKSVTDVPCTIASYVSEAAPNANYGTAARMRAVSTTNDKFGYFQIPFPDGAKGATILSATLKLYVAAAWAGSTTVTLKRITGAWREGRLTWTNKPSVVATNASALAVSAPVLHQELVFDITAMMQDVASLNGRNYQGFRIEVSATADRIFWADDYAVAARRPKLSMTWNHNPDPPIDGHPSEGRSIVSAEPIFTFKFKDADGADDIQSIQVQVSSAQAELEANTPDFDSGTYPTAAAEFPMADMPVHTGFIDTETFFWRVRCTDLNGAQSGWSDIWEGQRDILETVNITSPGATVEELSPPLTYTFTGTQTRWRSILEEKEDGTGDYIEIYNSGIIADAVLTHDTPEGLIKYEDASAYRYTIHAWDSVEREDGPGDPSYASDSQVFTFVPTATVTASTNMNAVAGEASIVLTFERTTQPDFFHIKRNGKYIAQRLDPADMFVSGTTYTYTDWRAAPGVAYTYEAVPVVISAGVEKAADANATDVATLAVEGIWLVAPDAPTGPLYVLLMDQGSRDLAIGEDRQVYFPIGSRRPFALIQSTRGYEGNVSGVLADYDGRTAEQWKSDMETMKGLQNSVEQRLIIGDMNIEVILGNVNITPSPVGTYDASVEVYQVGDWTFSLVSS